MPEMIIYILYCTRSIDNETVSAHQDIFFTLEEAKQAANLPDSVNWHIDSNTGTLYAHYQRIMVSLAPDGKSHVHKICEYKQTVKSVVVRV